MNWNPLLIAGSLLVAMSLASCGTTSSSTSPDGMTIRYPTVSDMERLEAQWGMQPKAKPAAAASPTAGAYVPEAATQTTATVSAPAPAPAETVKPAAPVTPSIPPSLR